MIVTSYAVVRALADRYGFGQDAEGLVADLGVHRVAARMGPGGTAGQDGRTSWNHEAPHDLASGCIPEPITDFRVERISVVALGGPGRRAVVETEQTLPAVVDGPEGAEGHVLAIRRVADCAPTVQVGDVDPAVALPRAHQARQRTELFICWDGHDLFLAGESRTL